jgi:YgiT-type zinc finger domain-containing protein
MRPITTSLPFKLSEERIIILKEIPVLQCGSCREYLLEDAVMARVDVMLSKADGGAELEVIRYAA